jgi:hypothetical protein
MTIQNDLDVTRNVRRVLVKHWIDLGRLSIRAIRGHVLIHGFLQRIPGLKEELTTPIVEAMFLEIKRVPGFQRMTPQIVNWINEGGRWMPAVKGAITESVDRRGETVSLHVVPVQHPDENSAQK